MVNVQIALDDMVRQVSYDNLCKALQSIGKEFNNADVTSIRIEGYVDLTFSRYEGEWVEIQCK